MSHSTVNKLSVIWIRIEYQERQTFDDVCDFLMFFNHVSHILVLCIPFRLALTAMNKFEEAVTSYQKALDLDPENDSYKSNLKIAEQKLREVSSPVSC